MRVVFKEEGDGVGTVTIIENEEPGEPGFLLGRPYSAVCTCDGPHMSEVHPSGGPCLTCGDWWQPWYRRAQAEEIADFHGVELEET